MSMKGQGRDRLARTIVHQVLTPLIGATVGVAYATRRWDLSAVGAGLAVTGVLALVWMMDRKLVQPHLERIPQDWLRFETEMFVSLAGHVLGALLALGISGRLFGFSFELSMAWLPTACIVLAFPILHGAELGLGYYRQLRDKERAEHELRALAAEAELRALKAQISPHFLFNALNTIAALIHTHPELAESSIERLAGMFRYVLASSERRSVPLKEELAFVDDYLEIERARFGQRLQVSRTIHSGALSVPVPSLILQPVVENAIQHGGGDNGIITLDIRVECAEGGVTVVIADEGSGMPPGYRVGDGAGHGLRNVDGRLTGLYHKGLAIETNEPTGTRVVIEIPAFHTFTSDGLRCAS